MPDLGSQFDVELAKSPPPTRPDTLSKHGWCMGVIFLVFACVRAIHPTIITASKSTLPDGSLGYAYEPAGPVILKNALVCGLAHLANLAIYGCAGWKATWTPKPMLVFGVNGALLALDDYLEMASLSKMHGAAYQILMQSKILITALLMIPFKGVYQTRLQWVLLTSLVLAMSLYMAVSTSGRGASGREIPFVAYMFTVTKVVISCFCSVYTDKYCKDYAKTVSLPVQLTQTYLARAIVATLMSSLTPQIWSNGFFHNWDALTVAATASFCVKSSMSFTVVAILDSILKNIAECVAVLLIFFYDVFAPWVDFEFDLVSFLGVMVIILVIIAYVDSKELVEKARKYDAMAG